MANDEKFSIISVNSDDDDEIVIQAGITHQSPAESSAEGSNEPRAELQPERSEQDQVKSDQRKTAPTKVDTYEETKAEDLKTEGPMAKTRITILVVAVLFLVGFLLYFNFMR